MPRESENLSARYQGIGETQKPKELTDHWAVSKVVSGQDIRHVFDIGTMKNEAKEDKGKLGARGRDLAKGVRGTKRT